MKIRYLLAAAMCLSTSALHAANVAVSNLFQTFGTTAGVGKSNEFDFQLAISFTTGPAITELSNITLNGFSFGTQRVAGLTFALYAGISTAGPTGLVATLVGETSPALGLPAGTYSYFPATPLMLASRTTYWLVASAPNTPLESAFSWRGTFSANDDPGPLFGWMIGDIRWVSNNGGTSWFASASTVIPQFQVNHAEPIPEISVQPRPQTVVAGNNVTLSVIATGSPPPTFQWHKDGVAIPGATGRSLTLSSVARNSTGNYSVAVSNILGSVLSAAALVDVVPANWLSNISVR